MPHISARLAALGISVLAAACSSPSHPPPELGDQGDGGSVRDGAGGGDSTVGDALAASQAESSDDGTATGEVPEAGAEDSEASVQGSSGGDAYEGPPGLMPEASDLFPPAPPRPPTPQSCATPGLGVSDCATDGGSCCAGSALPGGNFLRSYDGVTAGYTTRAFSAAVASVWLDQYEVTVGRFRRFVSAAVGGWLPPAGSGKHSHLNAGQGLELAGMPGANEAGWATSWNAALSTTADTWNTALACDPVAATWTPTAGANENLPANCMTWFEAYAFCIWDSGFLPSEAEWNYAASGGAEQRVYPWSPPATSATIDCSHANYYGAMMGNDYCTSPGVGATNGVGSESPEGDGKWGQSDLAGNVFEWNLDVFAPYVVPCSNCAYLTETSTDGAASTEKRVMRGGAFGNAASSQVASARNGNDPTSRTSSLGARCARVP